MAARIEYSEKYQDDCFEYRCEGHTGCINFPLAWAAVALYGVYVRKTQNFQPNVFCRFSVVVEKIGLIFDTDI